MKRRAFKLADGRNVTVERTARGVIIRDRQGNIITVSTNAL